MQNLRRQIMIGFALGVLVGVLDGAAFLGVGVEIRWADHNVEVLVLGFFAASFGGFGAAIGALRAQRAELTDRALIISEQFDALESSQVQLIEAEKLAAVGRVASGVAHEVRNPLGVIRSSAQLVRADLEDAQARQALGFICEEVDRLDSMITRLMQFTRDVTPALEVLEVDEILSSVERRVRADPRCVGVGVEIHGAPGVRVEVDAALWVGLIFGLCDNALDALAGAGALTIGVQVDGERVIWEVRDDGPGITEHERVFEPFVTTRVEGTGLGLAMARKIARVHDAQIESVPGLGLGIQGEGACLHVIMRGVS